MGRGMHSWTEVEIQETRLEEVEQTILALAGCPAAWYPGGMNHQVVFQPNERIVQEFSISNRLFTFLLLAAVLLVVGFPFVGWLLVALFGQALTAGLLVTFVIIGLILGAGIVGYALYFRWARHYILTNERVLATTGWIAQNTDSVNYEYITNIDVEQDVFERIILQTGLVKIESASAAVDVVRLDRVDQPYQIAAMIRQLTEERIKQLGGVRPATGGFSPTASLNSGQLSQSSVQPATETETESDPAT